MITDAVLDEAVRKGLVTSGQALALQSLARQHAPLPDSRAPAPDPEALRFVSGFADIFVTVGLALFLGSAGYLLGRQWSAAATGAAAACLAWALAEFFSRRRRMALPSIALLLAFVASAYGALISLAALSALHPGPSFGWLGGWFRFADRDPLGSAGAALLTALLILLHYLRFRVPIAVAALTGAVLLACLDLVYWAVPALALRSINPILFAGGIIAFALAMRFDLRDPERRTRRADIAFWLHLLAAPLLVHSAFAAIGGGSGIVSSGLALTVLGVFVAMGAVAVLVDRRALLVSGLTYAGIAFGTLLGQAGLSDTRFPAALLVVGALVLALSAGWAPLRRAILSALPESVAARLPATSVAESRPPGARIGD